MLLIISLVQPRPRARPLGKSRQAPGKETKLTRGAEHAQRMLSNGIALQRGSRDSDTRLRINEKATCLYGTFFPTTTCFSPFFTARCPSGNQPQACDEDTTQG